MRSILCALDPESGNVTVVTGRAYATRAEALDAAGRVAPADLVGREVFVVDLESATPVVVLPGAHTPGSVPTVADDEGAARTPTAAEEWPFVPSDLGGVGPSTLTIDSAEEDADRAQVWWLETGAEADAVAGPGGVTVVVAPDAEEVAPGAAVVATEPEAAEQQAEIPEPRAAVAPSDMGAFDAMRVDFEAWTCSDCIFLSTCTKTETHRPATCGSFQWKPE